MTGGLQSSNETEVINAIYNIDESFSQDRLTISSLRGLINHISVDVREASIIRLACRLRDKHIMNDIARNINDMEDILVFSASVRGVACICMNHENLKNEALNILIDAKMNLSYQNRVDIVSQAVKDIKKFGKA